MGAYNKYRGQHCCHNKILLKNILKNLWGFDGVVISDWGGTHSTNESIFNGLDIEMGTPSDKNKSERYPIRIIFLETFFEKIISGEVDERLLNDKVRRILKLMFRTSLNKNRPFGSINNSKHYKTAYNVATEGIVLLKNSEFLLPLDKKRKLKLLSLGKRKKIDEYWRGSSELKTDKEISPFSGIKKNLIMPL